MKCTGNSGSSNNLADDELKTSEMVETKRTMAMFLHGMDAFDDFLKLTASVDASQSSDGRLQIAVQTQGILDDDETSFFSDDSDDDLSKNVRSRGIPMRGVRSDHSGDLERLFRPKCNVKDEMGSDPSQVIRHTTDGAKRSKSLSKKPTRPRDLRVNALSEHGRRTCSSTNLDVERAAPDLSDDDNKATKVLNHHSSAHERTTKSVESTGHRRGRRVPPPTNSIIQQEAKDVPNLADPSCSPVSHELVRTESRGELRRSRGDLSASEHSRPRLRRDTLYATKRLPNSGTCDLDRTRIRPNSEIDFQRAAVTAAKKRQSAGKRISGGAPRTGAASPPRDGSSRDSLRYSTAYPNSSAELSELSPSRLPRSKTSGTNLQRSAGPKRSFNNLNLVGVYSNGAASSIPPIRTVEDLRRSLKKNGGRHDIDDLAVKMTRRRDASTKATSAGLQTTRGNATWN